MRKVDADHMKQRIDTPNNEQEKIIAEALVKFIDSEPDCQDEIQWVPAKRERKTRDCHSISYGVECSVCHNFESEAKRFCSSCGGRYNGVLVDKKSLGRVRRYRQWQ